MLVFLDAEPDRVCRNPNKIAVSTTLMPVEIVSVLQTGTAIAPSLGHDCGLIALESAQMRRWLALLDVPHGRLCDSIASLLVIVCEARSRPNVS